MGEHRGQLREHKQRQQFYSFGYNYTNTFFMSVVALLGIEFYSRSEVWIYMYVHSGL